MLEYLSTLPGFLVYLGLGIVLFVAFFTLYILITPQAEMKLIRAGNVSASVVVSGTLLGFAFPVSSAIAHSVNLVDLSIWGGVAAAVQILTYLVLRTLIGNLREHIEADRVSVAILMASLSIAMGMLNAAAMSY
jgi:putative membrane protein